MGGESRGMTPHSSTEFGGRQLIQRPFRRSTAADVDTAAHNRFTTGTIRAEMCAWMPGFRAKLSLDSDLIRAVAGKVWLYSGAKEGLQAKNGSVDGRVRGVKAPFFRTARLTWQHSAGKQPVKGGGVCRVIWTFTRRSRRCKASFHPSKAETSRISLRAYRKIPLSCPFLCRISAISAPDNWCIGRVAISGTQSDVCVRLKQTHHHPKGDTP